jgi:hypothetical protein
MTTIAPAWDLIGVGERWVHTTQAPNAKAFRAC